MGGIMKGGHGHMHQAAYSSRRRWINVYVVMVIVCLVFGCGIVGLMGLHRLKDRRILNLLIKEKDDQILSLHLLLQKEREHMQEIKRKTQDMRTKIFSLRVQKTELNGRVLDLQSTISSIREEQRTIELALQEKQNEAKLLRERYIEVKDQNPQVKALTEVLREKKAEIEDLKHRLQLAGTKVELGSIDENSILPANITAKAHMSENETMINENKDRDIHDERKNPADDMEGTRNDASRYGEIESSMETEEHGENGRLITGRSETTSKEEFDMMEISQERSAENGTNVDRNERVGSSETGVENNEYETEKIRNWGNEEMKPGDEDTKAHFADSKEFSTRGDAHSRRIAKSQGSDNQELGVHKGRVKSETRENSHSEHYGIRGKQGFLERAKGKRRRPIAEQTEGKRNSRNNGALTIGDQGLVKGMEEIGDAKPRNEGKIQNPIMGLRMQNELISANPQLEIGDKLPDPGDGEAMTNAKGYIEEDNGGNSKDSLPGIKSQDTVKPEDNEDMSHKVATFDMSSHFENGWEVNLTNSSSEKSRISLDEVPKYSVVKIEDTRSSNKGAVNHIEEDEHSKEQEITTTEHTEDKNDRQHNIPLGWKVVAETNEDPNGVQMGDFEESELGENSEDTDQTDEPEF